MPSEMIAATRGPKQDPFARFAPASWWAWTVEGGVATLFRCRTEEAARAMEADLTDHMAPGVGSSLWPQNLFNLARSLGNCGLVVGRVVDAAAPVGD